MVFNTVLFKTLVKHIKLDILIFKSQFSIINCKHIIVQQISRTLSCKTETPPTEQQLPSSLSP